MTYKNEEYDGHVSVTVYKERKTFHAIFESPEYGVTIDPDNQGRMKAVVEEYNKKEMRRRLLKYRKFKCFSDEPNVVSAGVMLDMGFFDLCKTVDKCKEQLSEVMLDMGFFDLCKTVDKCKE